MEVPGGVINKFQTIGHVMEAGTPAAFSHPVFPGFPARGSDTTT